ncbi:hypothetical protein TNCT_101261 [Trichonephila clavata]|uniref:Uncharacterized protein n=1 Tax=Trichonephila clavata TaxID=2740835 RepID=A0A8X6J3T7_TRICU|nr:hypothetical protein TNCT_101261 [Trichonephila clavata]
MGFLSRRPSHALLLIQWHKILYLGLPNTVVQHLLTGKSLSGLKSPVTNSIGGMGSQTARENAGNVDILRAEKTAEANCKEARTLGRAVKASENDNLKETDGLLYAPGIVD